VYIIVQWGGIALIGARISVTCAWFFMFLVSKNKINVASLEFFYMMPFLIYCGKMWNNLSWI
jgi:hypothetical protein